MYVSKTMIDQMIRAYGSPRERSFTIAVSDKEYHRIRSSQKHGRRHDVTVYAFKDDRIIVIAKPFYPPGLYRAPSGGLRPKELFVEGTAREFHEETGCHMELERFLLRTNVRFICDDIARSDHTREMPLPPVPDDTPGVIRWHSYVFRARYVSGDFQFTDRREIREVRLADLDEFEDFSRIMRSSDIGGLHYRAGLHDAVKGLLGG